MRSFRPILLVIIGCVLAMPCAMGIAQQLPDNPKPQSSGQKTTPPAAASPSAPQTVPPTSATPSTPQPTPPAPAPSPAEPSLPLKEKEKVIIPVAAERHFRQGVQNERDGDIEAAIDEYKDAIKEFPDYASAHYNLGHSPETP